MSSVHRSSLRFPTVALVALSLFGTTACETVNTAMQDRTTRDAVIGGVVGAAAGAAIDDRKRARGALIGAAVGGLAGGLIGNYLQKQAAEIDAIPDASVEGRGDTLVVGFPGDVMFDSGSSSVSPGAISRLDNLADTLVRYPETDVLVKGHTDSEGGEDFNLRLSETRAKNVQNYLISRGVAAYRLTSVGMGEQFPVATNATPEGRAQNRRVEIEITANQGLQERANSEGY